MLELIEEAKTKIDEDVEFTLMPVAIERDMERIGVLAFYKYEDDIIYYSATQMRTLNNRDMQLQIFVHELAHVYDLRSCVRDGLLKFLVPSNGISQIFYNQANDILHKTVEFQVSAFLHSEFGYMIPFNPKVEHDLADEISISLIPSIEYLHFGEVEVLKQEFRIKLNRSLGSRWTSIESILTTLDLADSSSFETTFPILLNRLGFNVRIKDLQINDNIRNTCRILQYCDDIQVRIYELIDANIQRSIFINS